MENNTASDASFEFGDVVSDGKSQTGIIAMAAGRKIIVWDNSDALDFVADAVREGRVFHTNITR